MNKRDNQKTQASVPADDVRVSAPRTSSPATSLGHQVTSAPVTSASSSKQESKPFDEFDLRDSACDPFGYVSAAPTTSNNAMDLHGSLSLIVPNTSTTTTSEVECPCRFFSGKKWNVWN